MSRVFLNAKDPDHEVVCGLDHAFGWFFQVFGPETEDGEENLIVDKDTMFDRNFGQTQMVELIREYAQNDAKSEHCICQISLDIDPALGIERFNSE